MALRFIRYVRYLAIIGCCALGSATIVATGGGGDGGGGGGGGGVSDRQLRSFSPASTGFYYNPPTLVDNFVG